MASKFCSAKLALCFTSVLHVIDAVHDCLYMLQRLSHKIASSLPAWLMTCMAIEGQEPEFQTLATGEGLDVASCQSLADSSDTSEYSSMRRAYLLQAGKGRL